MKKRFLLLTVLVLALITSIASAQDRPAITVWTKFNSDTPQNVQDEWMKATVDDYNAAGGSITNVFQPYDQINSKLNLAVQAGGDVPDVSYVDGQFLGFYDYNGTLTDITEWVMAQSWYEDLSPAALSACTTPAGVILCVPTATPGSLTYYWTELYPDGFPATAEELLNEDCPRLSAEGRYVATFKGTENFGLEVAYHSLIRSAGAAISDEEGRAAWANDEMVKVIEYVRSLFANKCAPEIALAGGFDFENSFKDNSAAAILAGTWTYVFNNPVTAPNGTLYDLGADSIFTAAQDGQIGFAPPLAFEGGQPASNVYATAWAIPTGSANPDEAKEFINFTMESQRNADFGVAYGSLPSLLSARENEMFQTGYWQQVAEIQNTYGTAMPFLVEYDRGIAALAEVFTKCLTDTSLDIMATLQAAQDNYNNSIQ
jgi:multiple sugar transport system substrate-binding protein